MIFANPLPQTIHARTGEDNSSFFSKVIPKHASGLWLLGWFLEISRAYQQRLIQLSASEKASAVVGLLWKKMAKWGEGDPRWIVEERPDATNVNNWHW